MPRRKPSWRRQRRPRGKITFVRKTMNIIDRIKDWPATLGGVLVGIAILADGWLRNGAMPDNWLTAVMAVVLGALTGSQPAPKATPVPKPHKP